MSALIRFRSSAQSDVEYFISEAGVSVIKYWPNGHPQALATMVPLDQALSALRDETARRRRIPAP